MFRRPDVYQLGIAVAPKPQAHLYNAWFQEIYMQTRETNADGYEQSAAINFAEGLGEATSSLPVAKLTSWVEWSSDAAWRCRGRPADRARHGRDQHAPGDS